MRLSVSIDDVVIDFDDENSAPTLDGIEAVLKRLTDSAFDLYSRTFERTTEQVFSIDFTPVDPIEDEGEDG